MRWRLLDAITELVPGERAAATATTNLPTELFEDHFPGFPVVPGVLLIEMGAQLAGRLVEVSVSQQRGFLVLPFLTMVQEAKLRRFVPPGQTLAVRAWMEAVRDESALCRVSLSRLAAHGDSHQPAAEPEAEERVASASLLFAFHPEGVAGPEDRAAVEAFERQEFLRLGLRGFPPGTVTVGGA